jgi:thiamine-monophosphate kinase
MGAGGRADERPGEVALIERFFAPLATDPGAVGLTDDAAVLAHAPGEEIVATTDALAAGVHFFADDPPGAIARKSLRVNLSDLAAKGARPRGYLLTLALPDDWTTDWLAAFCAGLADDQAAFGSPLLGGDTIRSPGALFVSVTAFGLAAAGRTVRRAGARPGDAIFVTGTIGDAAVGLVARADPGRAARWRLSADETAHLLDRYLLPRPRVAAAAAVAAHARAAMDVSDGLAGDLARLCRASGVSAEIDTERVPLSAAVRRAAAADPAILARALTGGDDYEILAAVPPERAGPFAEALAAAGVDAVAIGRIAAGGGPPSFAGADGRPLDLGPGSYAHF